MNIVLTFVLTFVAWAMSRVVRPMDWKPLRIVLTRGTYPECDLPSIQVSSFDESYSKDEPAWFHFLPLDNWAVNLMSSIEATWRAIDIAWRDGYMVKAIEVRL